jgi:serine/threonine protein kinase/WD40 repeat protein
MSLNFEITLQIDGTELGRWICGEGEFEVGSSLECGLPLQAEGVSHKHAALLIQGDLLQVEGVDPGALTRVNGFEISERVEVTLPANVRIGSAELHIRGSALDSVHQASEAAQDASGATAGARAVNAAGVTFIPSRNPHRKSVKRAHADLSEQRASTQVRYTLQGEIARGGMGRIYKGQDSELARDVAVKISTAGDDSDSRFWKEAKVLARLAHPNIVPIHATGRDEANRPFYSMKLIKGRTLQHIIHDLAAGDPETRKAFNRETMLTILRKICDALAFAHAHGILHRDIKPENVMVGEFGEVLVMDWGLAKILGETEEGAANARLNEPDPGGAVDGRTIEGDVLGTPQYMSPEQAAGLISELDERSDIYSLGALLFAMLTLRPPIEGKTLEEILTKVRRGEISTMMSRKTTRKKNGGPQQQEQLQKSEGVPEALRAVIRKAMSQSPDARYPSVQAFAAEIESFQNGYATKAEEAGVMRQLGLFVRRNRFASLVAIVFAIAAVGFVVKLAMSEAAARRAAANALMALAESAEHDQDAEEMERLLQSVAPSMRDERWDYLNKKLDSSVLTINAQEDSIWTAIVPHPTSPSELLTLQANGWLRSVNIKTGTVSSLFKCPDGGGSTLLAVSRDLKRVAIGKNGLGACKITTYALPKGEKQAEFQQPFAGWSSPSFRQSIAISPDGKLLLSHSDVYATPLEKRVKVWSLDTNKLVWEGGPKSAAIAEFIDATKIRITSVDDGIQELELPSGNLIKQNAKIPFPYGAGLLCSSNSNLFSFTMPVIRKLDPVSGKPLFDIRQPNLKAMDHVLPLKMLATVSRRSDRSAVLQFWSDSGGALARSNMVLGKFKSAWKVLAHPVSGDVAVVQDNLMKVYKFEMSKPTQSLSVLMESTGPTFSYLGAASRIVRLRSGSPPALETLDLKKKDSEKEPLFSYANSSFAGQTISVSKDQSTLAISGTNSRVYIHEEGKLKELFSGKLDGVPKHFAINPTGDLLWRGSAVYETTSGTIHCKIDRSGIEVPVEGVVSVKWIGQSRVAEIGLVQTQKEGEERPHLERAIIVWDANTGERLKTIAAPDAEVLAVHSSGRLIAEGGSNMRVRIHNIERDHVEKEFRTHDGPITDIEWHPRGQYIVTCSEDMTVRISDYQRNMALVEELRGFERAPKRLFISPDNQKLGVIASRGTSDKAEIYDIEAFRVTTR